MTLAVIILYIQSPKFECGESVGVIITRIGGRGLLVNLTTEAPMHGMPNPR